MKTVSFPALLQRFFTDRLCTQMEASRHTIAGYRGYVPAADPVRKHTMRQTAH